MADASQNLDPERLDAEMRRARRLARALVGDEHDGEDVAQDAWVTALSRPPREGWCLGNWLAGIVKNHARQLGRTERRRMRRESVAAASNDTHAIDDTIERLDLLRHVLAQARQLDELYRSTILLRYIDGHDAAEVARRLGVPHATVRTRLKRGIEQLRARMDSTVEGGRRAWLVPIATLSFPEAANAAAGAAAPLIVARAKTVTSTIPLLTMKKTTVALFATAVGLCGTLTLIATMSGILARPVELPNSPQSASQPAPEDGHSPLSANAMPEEAAIRTEVGTASRPRPGPKAASLTVRGIVRDEDGRPIGGARVDVLASDEAGKANTSGPSKTAGSGNKWADKGGGKGQWLGKGRFFESGTELPKGIPTGTESATDGTFAVRLDLDRQAEPDWVWVRASAERFVTQIETYARADDLEVDLRLAAAMTIAGRVLTEAGAPIGNARVSTVRRAQEPVITDAEGSFRMTDIDPRLDKHFVTAAADGYVSSGVLVDIETDSSQREQEVTVVLERGSRVFGTVVSNREPVDSATVWIGVGKQGLTTRTDGEGKFTLDGLRPGESTLTAHHPEFLPTTENIDVPSAGGVREVTVSLEAGRALTGIVLDLRGQPISGARVGVSLDRTQDAKSQELRATKSDERGQFELAGLPNQGLTVRCSAAGFQGVVDIAAPPYAHYLTVTLECDIALHGRVTDENNQPLAGAAVRALRAGTGTQSTNKGGATHSDEGGAFELDQVGPGTWNLFVEPPERNVFVQPFEIPEGVLTWEVNVQLHSQGTVRGIVKAADGQVIPAARVQLQSLDIPAAVISSNTTADAAGRFSFTDLPPGGYELRHLEASEGPDGKSLWRHAMVVNIDGRAPQNVVLMAAGTAVVRGTLSASIAIPAPAYVQLAAIQDESTRDGERVPPRWARARDGTFEFGNVGAGRYELRYSFRDLRGTQRIEVRDGSVQFVILALEPATTGR